MPLFYDKVIDSESRICIWEITESLEQLEKINLISNVRTEKEIKSKTLKRQLEWHTIRILLKKILNMTEDIEIVYNEYGKPDITGIKKHISISHTKQFVAVAVHTKKKIGIDIEIVTPRIEKIKHKFLSEKESEWSNGTHSLEKLYIIWGAKESAFKIYSEGGLDFKKMLEVKPFEYVQKGDTILILKKNNVTCAYPAWWENLKGLMLIYAFES